MDKPETKAKAPARRRARKTAADPVAAVRERWYPSAQAWIVGRTVTWPEDLADLVRVAGAPCVDCLEVVRHDGRHRFTYAKGSAEHWASGIEAHCGVTPTV